MAFGIPSSSDLSALATQIGTIVQGVGPMEQAVLSSAMQQLSDHASALEKQSSADIGQLVTDTLAQAEAILTRQREAFFADLDARLGVTVNLHWIPPVQK